MAHKSPLTAEPKSSTSDGRANSHDEKAKILLALLGRSRLEALRAKGLELPLPAQLPKEEQAEDLAQMRRQAAGLLRLATRAKASPSAGRVVEEDRDTKSVTAKPAKTKQAAPSDLSSRLIVHLDDLSLQEEHPAVIAHLLRSQSPQARAKLLRMLPGRQARAAMRILRQDKAG